MITTVKRMYEIEFSGGHGDSTWINIINIQSTDIETALFLAKEALKNTGEGVCIFRVEEVD